ncbi:M14 family zinc carboxypeptidase [Sphaerisporangium sp. B11E5]|uniref:M14 family zinc carboxypeptidase n=1 Tax=Sphaerisporangium sp. B11E5 TaxID=3153563 RepID=UPI00325E3186
MRAIALRTAAVLTVLTVSITASPAAADPPVRRDGGPAAAQAARPPHARATGTNRPRGEQGYPRRTELRVFEEVPDESVELGLVPYHALAPKLNTLQSVSDRVSVEVAGESVLGRDLYLVTLTAPETPEQAAEQTAWRDEIRDDPEAAARDPRLRAGYKTPLWVNANIHGNEWEGTDGALRVIEHFATTTDDAALALLRRNRIHISLSSNPDGRVAGSYFNAEGFNLNRDFVTASQPETRAMRDTLIRTQPLLMLDEHGYVAGTLIEPTTPPHGQNYDMDLFIGHGLDAALRMEQAVEALGHPETADPVIPFRDLPPGDWDGWAPFYTAQYAMYHGAVSSTVEIPLQMNNQPPGTDLIGRGRKNTDVVEATIQAALGYVDEHRTELIDGQIEMFRRGAAGEPQRHVPDGFVPGWGPEDRYTTEFPRAYVVPTGDGQRSATAAARLVDHLVANDVRVRQADRPFTLGGRSYPAGSYLVDMHQPKRALANVMLETGADISGRVPASFDTAAWSHRLLWGATVDVVASGPAALPGHDVTAASPTGGVDGPPGADLAIRPVDAKDVAAVNALLGQGVTLRRRADGTFVVPAGARRQAAEAAERFGVRFRAAGPGEPGVTARRPVVAAAVAPEELVALRGMDFDVRPVSTEIANAGFDWSGVDVLLVSSGLQAAQLTADARRALDEFLARGGVVTRGLTGTTFNDQTGLLPVTAKAGPSRASGLVSVLNGSGPIVADAPPHSLVSRPIWFTALGAGVTAEQRYGPGDPLVAGHWRPFADGTGGSGEAAGRPSVVSGTSEQGTRVVLFGTEPLFRDHPKGLYAQLAAAVFWAMRQ